MFDSILPSIILVQVSEWSVYDYVNISISVEVEEERADQFVSHYYPILHSFVYFLKENIALILSRCSSHWVASMFNALCMLDMDYLKYLLIIIYLINSKFIYL